MLLIDDVLVSDDILSEQFLCNLKACKGACCVEGDAGAPLNADELPILAEIYEAVKPYLTIEGRAAIETQGFFVEDDDAAFATPLIDGAACAYIAYDDDGTAKCGIEQAYLDGKITWKKPISCHLYPIRVQEMKFYTALNYDRWDICKAACSFGKQQQLPMYQFLKDPLTRRFGAAFYEQLDKLAKETAGNTD
ncbi:MAG: hypothetical protein RI894_2583 [Bacteroidota bacterium]|jgi:hypothetical protein